MRSVSTVIVLNGVGSVGKSSIARALQEMAREPLLHVQMDAFLDMLPSRLENDPSTFLFLQEAAAAVPTVSIEIGPVGYRLLDGMHGAIAALADAGNNLVVDDVMLHGEADVYRRLLASHRLGFVGIHAPLHVIEAREQQRGDRMPGLARWQFERVHKGMVYDLDVDTERDRPEACAERIREHFDL